MNTADKTPNGPSPEDAPASRNDEMITVARALARTWLAPLPRRWSHTLGVAAAAERLAIVLPEGDRAAVVAAALVHDIGYSPQLARSGFHPIDGARFLHQQGLPSVVVALVAHHTGAAVEAEQRGLTAALAQVPCPPPAMLDVLTCADLSTSPTGQPVRVEDRIAEILTRYPADHLVHRAVLRSTPDLLAAATRVRNRLAATRVSERAANPMSVPDNRKGVTR